MNEKIKAYQKSPGEVHLRDNVLLDKDNLYVADCGESYQDFIFRAVNSHSALVAALRWALIKIPSASGGNDWDEKDVIDYDAARAALALAEGKDAK